jgi:hypothetical protein
VLRCVTLRCSLCIAFFVASLALSFDRSRSVSLFALVLCFAPALAPALFFRFSLLTTVTIARLSMTVVFFSLLCLLSLSHFNQLTVRVNSDIHWPVGSDDSSLTPPQLVDSSSDEDAADSSDDSDDSDDQNLDIPQLFPPLMKMRQTWIYPSSFPPLMKMRQTRTMTTTILLFLCLRQPSLSDTLSDTLCIRSPLLRTMGLISLVKCCTEKCVHTIVLPMTMTMTMTMTTKILVLRCLHRQRLLLLLLRQRLLPYDSNDHRHHPHRPHLQLQLQQRLLQLLQRPL